jgi:hypothetical protein
LSLTIELKRQAPLLERERLTWLVLHKTLYHSYRSVGNTNTTYYCIANTGTDEFEVGIGTVTDAATDTLSRDTVISNNLGTTAKIDFGSGEKEVFCTIPAKKAMSPVMEATGYVVTHASTLDEDQTLDSGVLAGPVTITGTQTITGTLVII